MLVRDDDIQKVQLSEQDQRFIKASREVEKEWKKGDCQQGYQPYYDACEEMLEAIGKKGEVDATWIIRRKPTTSL